MGQRLQQPARLFGLGQLRGQLVDAAHVSRNPCFTPLRHRWVGYGAQPGHFRRSAQSVNYLIGRKVFFHAHILAHLKVKRIKLLRNCLNGVKLT